MSDSVAQAFYDHKREVHNGQYDSSCSECQQKWAALLAASKAKAGVA